MDISKTECKRILRTLELKAYRSVVDALRAQGALTKNKHDVLKNLAVALKVSEERYRSEMRRAANDDLLNTIAQYTSGENTEAEWRVESMKKVPFTPMIASQTAFTALADTISDILALENEKLSNSSESSNVIESYKCRGEENLEKYSSSKVLGKLLQKRKNHHQDEILSELERIKSNNNYCQSAVKSSYIEVSYDEPSSIVEAPIPNPNPKTVSWKTNDEVFPLHDIDSPFKSTSSSKAPRKSAPKTQLPSSLNHVENANLASDSHTEKSTSKRKSKSKNKVTKPAAEHNFVVNSLKEQDISKTRNLRTKPLKKYTLNSVEIQTFADDDLTQKPSEPKSGRSKSAANVNKIITQIEPLQESLNSGLSETVDSSNGKNASKVSRNRKSKRRMRGRTKSARKSKIVQVRKLVTSQRIKTESVKEAPLRTSRISMRNARRRNYARMASGNDDLAEYKTPVKENKIETEDIKKETVDEEEEEEEIEATDPDAQSDCSSAPIEVSYNNPVPPKSSNYELEDVSANFTEDDMRPHTFNLIPASRRLKMLKKRAKSPLNNEVPAKKSALSSESESDQNLVVPKSSNDINALKKVLAAHENMGNVSMCNASDLPETMKELLDISDCVKSSDRPKAPDRSKSSGRPKLSDRLKPSDHPKASDRVKLSSLSRSRDSSEIKVNPPSIIPHLGGGAPEKHTKPKIKLAEASTLENLSSLLSKVKEGDLKRLSNKGNIKKPLTNRMDNAKKKSSHPSSVEKEGGSNLIEVNNLEHASNSSSFSDENNDTVSKDKDSKDHIMIENNEDANTTVPQQNNNNQALSPFATNDEVVSITMDEVEDLTESDVSEQLIDIESADIIISDHVDHNGEFTIVNNDANILATELEAKEKNESFKNIKLITPSPALTTNDNKKFSKDDIIVINADKSENVALRNNSGINEKNTNIQSINKTNSLIQPINVLAAASDFRYVADVDDPTLKRSPVPLLPKTSFIISKASPTTINETGKITAMKTVKPIVLNSLNTIATTTASQNLSRNIILTKSSLTKKEGPFILLDTGSTLGSKSLLKSVKTLPKIIPVNNHSNNAANDVSEKPKKLAIYSSLKNINVTSVSNFPKTALVKTTNVTSILKQDDLPSTDNIIVAAKSNDASENSKSSSLENDGNSKRAVFSRALENSLKSIEAAKSAEKSENKISEESKSLNNFHEIIEISSNEPPAESNSTFDNCSENNAIEVNKLKTFFSKNIIRKSS